MATSTATGSDIVPVPFFASSVTHSCHHEHHEELKPYETVSPHKPSSFKLFLPEILVQCSATNAVFIDEWMDEERCYVSTMEYYSTITIVKFHHTWQHNGTGGCYIKSNQINWRQILCSLDWLGSLWTPDLSASTSDVLCVNTFVYVALEIKHKASYMLGWHSINWVTS